MKAPSRALSHAFLGQGLASGGSFVLTILLVRGLRLAAFGELSLVLIVAGYAAGLVQALVAQPLLSLGALVEGEERRTQAREALWLAAPLVVVLGAAAAVGVALVPGAGLTPAVGGGLVLLRGAQPAVRAALFALERRRRTLAYDASIPWSACVGLLALGKVDLESAALLLVASAALGLVVGAAGLADLAAGRPPGREALRRHWNSGRWLAANQALSWVGSGGVHASAAVVLGPAAVGAIRAAQSLVGAVLVAAQALELALPGRAAEELRSGGVDGLERWCRTTARTLGAAFLALGVALVATAPWLAARLFPGTDPAATVEAITGLAWLPTATVIATVLQVRLRATATTRPIFVAYALSAVLVGALALPLVEALGLFGAALGLTLGQALFTCLLAAFTTRSSLYSNRATAGPMARRGVEFDLR